MSSEESPIKLAVEYVFGVVLDLLQADPHQWSTRPCSTCQAISKIVSRPFGCVLYKQQREPEGR